MNTHTFCDTVIICDSTDREGISELIRPLATIDVQKAIWKAAYEMTIDNLAPSLDILNEEYVLIQAWKKTATYIRYHSWYADTLELDATSINLRSFLAQIRERLGSAPSWTNDPIRIVAAPKSQSWQINATSGGWEPERPEQTEGKLRPLAKVSLADQVLATALMMCLADRVETLQGDPRGDVSKAAVRQGVISYGNRLFCDGRGGQLRHRWGSSKIYRAYYHDYRKFLTRSDVAASSRTTGTNERVVIVHSDLRQFFDRVRPATLTNSIEQLRRPQDDPGFYALARSLFDWQWHRQDAREVARYATQSSLPDFQHIALPQGLVSAGFFANIVLLHFDDRLRKSFRADVVPGLQLVDASRYVDDVRLVLVANSEIKLDDIENQAASWLQSILNEVAPDQQVSQEKTRAAAFEGGERPLVRQSRKMARIQAAVSGGFDAIGGEEILDAVEGLIRSQRRYSEEETEGTKWSLSPIPDVRDSTIARFAAGRFRSTYRSLRPLLAERSDSNPEFTLGDSTPDSTSYQRQPRTRADLDDETRAFALGLIENWVRDPSNVRLLRIGLDLWPAPDVIRNVLALLRPFTSNGGRRKAPRRVAWYCLSEIFRAAATETGFVENDESFPDQVDIHEYRAVLFEEAKRLLALPGTSVPWYLCQQVLLFVAAYSPHSAPVIRSGKNPETKRYRELIRYLRGDKNVARAADFATVAILSRRGFLAREAAVQRASGGLTARRIDEVAERDPAFATELIANVPDLAEEIANSTKEDLCLLQSTGEGRYVPLTQLVFGQTDDSPLRNELAILEFSVKLLQELKSSQYFDGLPPGAVLVELDQRGTQTLVAGIKIRPPRSQYTGSMYAPPTWCEQDQRWKFQLGFLLRFILLGQPDFTRTNRLPSRKEGALLYRMPESHWYQRLYGLFNGHAAFGDDWLPISEWIEDLLFALLSWPGCRRSDEVSMVRRGLDDTLFSISLRARRLKDMWGISSDILMLPLRAPWPLPATSARPMRVCVVQTALPAVKDFEADLSLSDPSFRRRHRNHLSSALAAVERMLDLRETHNNQKGRLDWLILPELSVHPNDVKTHLIPFARAHKTIILAGLVYEELFPSKPFVNAALWIIPVWTQSYGLQMIVRRQGKHHLAPEEIKANDPVKRIQGFRPCQWIVGYEWSKNPRVEPLRITSSICYDATDLALVSDLRDKSDVFAIPALNKDVGTFDHMALALHYHMFQMVIVANTGMFGGSNAYVPYREAHLRQVFHLHGQPQASIAFLEIENIAEHLARVTEAKNGSAPTLGAPARWKYPPAGM